MKISVMVKPGAKQDRIEKTGNNQFSAWVKARPEAGKANRAAAEILAEYFGIAKSRVTLIKGRTSKQKIFEIKEPEK